MVAILDCSLNAPTRQPDSGLSVEWYPSVNNLEEVDRREMTVASDDSVQTIEVDVSGNDTDKQIFTLLDLTIGQTYFIQLNEFNAEDEIVGQSETVEVTVSSTPDAPLLSKSKSYGLEYSVVVVYNIPDSVTPVNDVIFTCLKDSQLITEAVALTDAHYKLDKESNRYVYEKDMEKSFDVSLNHVCSISAYCVNAVDNSADSAILKLKATKAPSAPTNLSVFSEKNSKKIIIGWDVRASGSNAVSSYTVYRRLTEGNTYNEYVAIATNLQSSVLSYTDSEIEFGTSYDYCVEAQNEFGRSAKSEKATRMAVEDISAPVNLTASCGFGSESTSVKLTFEKPLSNGGFDITGYVLYRHARNDSSPNNYDGAEEVLSFAEFDVSNNGVYSMIDEGESNMVNHKVTYSVRATTANPLSEEGLAISNTEMGAAATVTIERLISPNDLEDLDSDSKDKSALLKWTNTATSANPVTHFTIYQQITYGLDNENTKYEELVTIPADPKVLNCEYEVSDLVNGTEYKFGIIVSNKKGDVVASTHIQEFDAVTPLAGHLPAVEGFTAECKIATVSTLKQADDAETPIDKGDAYVELNWNRVDTVQATGEAYNVSYYQIEVDKVDGSGNVIVANDEIVWVSGITETDNQFTIDSANDKLNKYKINVALPIDLSYGFVNTYRIKAVDILDADNDITLESKASYADAKIFRLPEPPTLNEEYDSNGDDNGIGIMPGNKQITLNWLAPAPIYEAGSPIQKYKVVMSGASSKTSYTEDATPSFTALNLVNGKKYSFDIYTVTSNGLVSTDSLTLSDIIPYEPPSQVTNLTLDLSGNVNNKPTEIVLKWTPSTGNVTGYYVFSNKEVVATVSGKSSKSSTITISSLINDHLNVFEVAAYYTQDSSTEMGELSNSVTYDTDFLDAVSPSLGDCFEENCAVTLNWGEFVDVSGCELVEYRVYQLLPKNNNKLVLSTSALTCNIKKIRDVALVNGEEYTFDLRAYVKNIYTNKSQELVAAGNSVTLIPRDVPSNVTGLKCEFDNDELTVSWTAPSEQILNGSTFEKYLITVSPSIDSSPISLDELFTSSVDISLNEFKTGVEYTISIVIIGSHADDSNSIMGDESSIKFTSSAVPSFVGKARLVCDPSHNDTDDYYISTYTVSIDNNGSELKDSYLIATPSVYDNADEKLVNEITSFECVESNGKPTSVSKITVTGIRTSVKLELSDIFYIFVNGAGSLSNLSSM